MASELRSLTPKRNDCGESAAGLEALGHTSKEGAARAELRSKYAQPSTGANLVDLIKQVDDVKAKFESFVEPGVDRLHNTEINLLIAG